ncbi:Serine/threonine kinase [Entamoeba marina]
MMCSSCLNDLILNYDQSACGECSVEHCSTCYINNFNKCYECETGYLINSDEDECQQCTVSNCGLCVKDKPIECSSCNSGYYPSIDNTECNVCVANCYTCGSETTCTVCNEGYFPSIDGTECIDCPDNCVECHKDGSDNIICDVCNYTSGGSAYSYYYGDYTRNEGSTACVSNIANCASYNAAEENICVECDSKYVLEENICNICIVNHCASCTDSVDQVCTTCEYGYHVFTTTESVTLCVADITNCIIYDATDGTTCAMCSTYYYLNEDGTACLTCITSDNHCTACTDSKTCSSCDFNYYLNSDNTACETCITDSNHCAICSSADTCTNCKSGYVLDNSECKSCPSNCVQCNKADTSKCEVCADGYFITEGYTCSACSSKCQEDILSTTSTIDNYICNDAEYTCYVNQDNHCKRLSSDGRECIQCESPYTLDEGECYPYNDDYIFGYDGKTLIIDELYLNQSDISFNVNI